jgi:hypothetical protein
MELVWRKQWCQVWPNNYTIFQEKQPDLNWENLI